MSRYSTVRRESTVHVVCVPYRTEQNVESAFSAIGMDTVHRLLQRESGSVSTTVHVKVEKSRHYCTIKTYQHHSNVTLCRRTGVSPFLGKTDLISQEQRPWQECGVMLYFMFYFYFFTIFIFIFFCFCFCFCKLFKIRSFPFLKNLR